LILEAHKPDQMPVKAGDPVSQPQVSHPRKRIGSRPLETPVVSKGYLGPFFVLRRPPGAEAAGLCTATVLDPAGSR